jgi:hypothetical protein
MNQLRVCYKKQSWLQQVRNQGAKKSPSPINFSLFEVKKMSKFWLYFGIFLACTGVGTVPGILLIVFYFWEDLKKTLNKNCIEQQSNTLPEDPQFYDDDTIERMK